ncbi:MAG: MinD/ParA family ATP-binding protein [Lacipirellulaceae bacterium]
MSDALDNRSAARAERSVQARELASRVSGHAARDREAAGPMVVVVGAKGGVGASSVTMALARGLAECGAAALAVDAHLGRGDLALVAGWRGETTPGIESLLSATATPACVRGVDRDVHLIAGQRGRAPAIADLAAAARRVVQTVVRLAPRSAWTLFDAGDAFGSWSAELAQIVGRVLLVTTPEPLSVLTAYGALKHLRRVAPRAAVALVVNRCADQATAEGVHRCVAQAAERFAAPLAPLAGWSPPGETLAGAAAPRVVARALAERLVGAGVAQPKPGAAVAA